MRAIVEQIVEKADGTQVENRTVEVKVDVLPKVGSSIQVFGESTRVGSISWKVDDVDDLVPHIIVERKRLPLGHVDVVFRLISLEERDVRLWRDTLSETEYAREVRSLGIRTISERDQFNGEYLGLVTAVLIGVDTSAPKFPVLTYLDMTKKETDESTTD